MQEYRPTSSLKPHPLNAKIYRDASDTDLCDSVKRFGILQPILITEGGLIISGHRRWARLRQTTQKKGCRENPWGLSWKPRPGADMGACSPMSLSMGRISILNLSDNYIQTRSNCQTNKQRIRFRKRKRWQHRFYFDVATTNIILSNHSESRLLIEQSACGIIKNTAQACGNHKVMRVIVHPFGISKSSQQVRGNYTVR